MNPKWPVCCRSLCAFVCAALVLLLLAPECAAECMGESVALSKAAHPITASERFRWFGCSSVGPESLAGGLVSAGFSTAFNTPREYGPHWEGFGKRYGLRLTGVSTGNAIEGGLGAALGEEPRYFRAPGQPFKTRVGHTIKMTFVTENRNGGLTPAYARLAAIPASNFLSNAWRPDSSANASDALMRSLIGLAGKMGGNAFNEFWPDIQDRLLHKSGKGKR